MKLRLALDFAGLGLLLAALAYYWLGNAAHEAIGTGLFGLLILHNGFNRRWYGHLPKARGLVRAVTAALNLTLLGVMLALLGTSVMLSETVFAFLGLESWGLEGGVTARNLHILAAWWALVIVAVHLGLSWTMIMGVTRNLAGITGRSTLRTVVLRLVAAALALYGIRASFELMLGTKLFAEIALDMWDFNAAALRFFANAMAIVGLYAAIGHYGVTGLRRLAGRRVGHRPAPDLQSRNT